MLHCRKTFSHGEVTPRSLPAHDLIFGSFFRKELLAHPSAARSPSAITQRMDIATTPGSKIITVSRAAFARPDTDFLCFGESDVAAPTVAHQALKAALDAGHTRYPDVRGLPALRHALADHLTARHAIVEEPRIQITGSGMAAVNVAMAAILRPGDRLVHVTPAWPNSANAARMRHAEVEELPLTDTPEGGFRLDLDRLAHRLVGARALFINSPSNPTGWTANAEEMRAILALCRATGAWLIADEVYNRLTYDSERAASILDIAAPDDRVLVVCSFSKAWAMTGFRIGWLVVPEGTRDRFSELVEITHSGVAAFIQHAALAALADEAFVKRFRDYCAAGRSLTTQALSGLDRVRFAQPPGAFYAFLGVESLADSLAFALRLVAEFGVAVAPGAAFCAGGEGHLRLCFAQSPMRLERALSRLRDALTGAEVA
jgi:aspartate aminotransferase